MLHSQHHRASMADAFVLRTDGLDISSDYLLSHLDDIYQLNMEQNSLKCNKSYRLYVILGEAIFIDGASSGGRSSTTIHFRRVAVPGTTLLPLKITDSNVYVKINLGGKDGYFQLTTNCNRGWNGVGSATITGIV